MIVSETLKLDLDTTAVETTPVRDLAEVLAAIKIDAQANAPQYLTETEVPHGGE